MKIILEIKYIDISQLNNLHNFNQKYVNSNILLHTILTPKNIQNFISIHVLY